MKGACVRVVCVAWGLIRRQIVMLTIQDGEIMDRGEGDRLCGG